MSATPYFQDTAERRGEVVPIRGLAVLVRDRLADRRQALDEFDELGALDVTAAMLAELHDSTVGRVPALAADRTPRYRRGQFAGESSLPLEDLVWLLLADQAAAAAVLEPLLLAIGRRSVPRQDIADAASVRSEAVDLIALLTESLAAWTRTLHREDAELGHPKRRATDVGDLVRPDVLRERLAALEELIDQAERLRAALRRRAIEEQEARP